MTAFNSADRIITYAMRDAGLLQEGDSPSTLQYNNYINNLNDILNFLQTQGCKLWLQYDEPIPLVAAQTTYTMKLGGNVNIIKPLRVLQGYYLDSNGVKRPLTPLSRDEYSRLSQTTQQGSINSYFVDKQRDQLAVSFWLTPDTSAATGTAHLIIQNQVGNISAITDTMDFPQEWFLALRWGLADDICTGQPQAIMDRCMAKATAYREALEAWDVEDASTYFQPDQQMGEVW